MSEELKTLIDLFPTNRDIDRLIRKKIKAEAVKWIKEDLRNPDHDEREIKKWMNRLNISKEDLEEEKREIKQIKYTEEDLKKEYWRGYEHGRQGSLLHNIELLKNQYKGSKKAEKENE